MPVIMNHDDQDLVPDLDVLACRTAVFGGAWNVEAQGLLWGLVLRRRLSRPEIEEIRSKINGLGPVRLEDSLASVVRSKEVCWRSQRVC